MKKLSKIVLMNAFLAVLIPQYLKAQEKLEYHQVIVHVSLSTGESPVNVEVRLNYTNLIVTDSSGTAIFDSVASNHIDLSAFKIGYDFYSAHNIFINEDKVFNIVLSEKKYPPTCLYVDPVSLEATWCEPLITALDEDFEDPAFPPAGWQTIPSEGGWFRTDTSTVGCEIPDWNSNYAMACGSYGLSSRYLITPPVDLRESEGYKMTFDSFYDGNFGTLAFIQWSTDSGETWEMLCQLAPNPGWCPLTVDLAAFSGPDGPEQIMFSFKAYDANAWTADWAIDNVKIQVPSPTADYIDFYVYLDDTLVGISPETNWNFAPLDYGQSHTACVKARYSSGLSACNYYDFTSEYLFPPDSLSAIAPDDAAILTWYPPSDSCCPPSGQLPSGLLGYNIYKDQEFLAYTPHDPPGVYTQQGYIEENLYPPGMHEYTVTAVYDLTSYGYPGDTAESVPDGPAEISSCYCMELDFIENWDLGNFEDNNWTIDGDNWSINGQEGKPAPTAEFTWDPSQEYYSIALTSYPISAIGMTEGIIWLDYDLKLETVSSNYLEKMNVEVWEWESQEWTTVAEYSNGWGSFDWTTEHINIKSYAMGNAFQVRFRANGANSLDIVSWSIDNVHIYRACHAPYDLMVESTLESSVVLQWTSPYGPPYIPDWLYWENGTYGNSFGTGAPMEFDCAARWEPEQLNNLEGAWITQIAFYPAESDAIYSVRLWKGENAADLIVDMVVEYPIIGELNYMTLYNPVQIDITQELWVGYHVSTQSGYPAGVDNGPAIQGYGNMINIDGWQTLDQVNPAFDANWNIEAHLQSKDGSRSLSGYNIYRSEYDEEYIYLDYTTETDYVDDNLPGPDLYCYKVSAVWESETDMCESDFTNNECLWVGIASPDPDAGFTIYPNPAHDYLMIIPGKVTSDREISVSIYNSSGSLLQNNYYRYDDGGEIYVNLQDYPCGIYWITISNDNEILGAEKFIIAR